MRFRIKLICFFMFVSVFAFAQKKDSEWTTYYEKSNFLETPNYDATIDYCKKLDKASEYVKYFTYGKSHEGRDLPALLISNDKNLTSAQQKKSKKALIMIQCGIHAGEIDGKDAMMMLIRDIVITKKYPNILDHVNLLILPIFNVDGHEKISPYNRINQNGPKEMGWRVNALNLNLNRDYLKAESNEIKSWLTLFNEWMPDFFIDCHVSDGSDWPYTAMFEAEKNQNMNKGIADWTKKTLVPYVLTESEKCGHQLIPYAGYVDEFDISKGILSGAMSPKLSTGYTAARNRQGFLIETHSYKDYKTRVDATYQICRIIIQLINGKEYANLKNLNKLADDETNNCFRKIESVPFVFKNNNNSIPFNFRAYKMIKEKSIISGVEKRSYEKNEESYQIPYYNSVDPVKSAKPPFGYVIPKQWSSLVDILKLHGVKVKTFSENETLPVTAYRLTDPKWREKPYEGRHMVSYSVRDEKMNTVVKSGSYFIPINQQAAKVIMFLLEPNSPDSFVSWGFMDAIFEQKEFAEQYVLEKYALELYNEDAKIRNEFDMKVKTDTAFANNPDDRLDYFYKKLPYHDNNVGLYPILRIENETRLKLNNK
jgi:hypothetical protein